MSDIPSISTPSTDSSTSTSVFCKTVAPAIFSIAALVAQRRDFRVLSDPLSYVVNWYTVTFAIIRLQQITIALVHYSFFIGLMSIETLEQARDSGVKITTRCAPGEDARHVDLDQGTGFSDFYV
jgi:hypothetical protein